MKEEKTMTRKSGVAQPVSAKNGSVSKLRPTTPQTGDLEPVGQLLGSLFRWSWLIAAVVAVVAGTAWVLGDTDSDDAANEATVRLGLTEQTEWPFYDVELEAGRFLATTAEFQDAVEDRVGYEVDSVGGNLPESLAVFDVTVVADSPENAVAAANVAAALMVESTVSDATKSHVLSLERADIEIADIQARIAEVEAEGTAAGEALTALYVDRDAGNDDPALSNQEFEFQTRRQEAASIHNDLGRTLVALEADRASSAAWFTGAPTLRIIREAAPGEASDSSRIPVAIAAGFGALLLASAIVVALDRRVGRVRSSWQLANVAGAPVHTELGVGPGAHLSGCGALADVIEVGGEAEQTKNEQTKSERKVLGVINLADALELEDLAQSLSAHGLDIAVVPDPNEPGPQSISLVDVSDEYRETDTPRSLSRLCDSLILFVDKQQSLSRTTAIVTQSSRNPGLLSAAVVRGAKR